MISKKIGYFTTLAECLSFTQTAAKYDVSQTAISQYIVGLEQRVGVRLFNRTQRSVTLTEAGKYYYARVTAIRRAYEETLTLTRAVSADFKGILKIGIGMYEACSTERFIAAFISKYPEIKVDILQYPYSELTEKLRIGELDVLIADELCEKAFSRHEIVSRQLFASPNYLMANPELFERYRAKGPAALLKEEYLITNCESGGPSSLGMLNDLLNNALGFIPEHVSQTNSINAQLMLVRAGQGAAIVPGFVIDAVAADLKRFPEPIGETISYNIIALKETDNQAVSKFFEFEA